MPISAESYQQRFVRQLAFQFRQLAVMVTIHASST